MRVSCWGRAALCLLVHGWGGAHPADVSRFPSESAAVRGWVANLLTGTPIEGAKVMIVNADGSLPPVTMVTENSGVFLFPALAPGDYRLWAERSGYEAQQFGAKSANVDGATLSLRAGQIVDDISFRLLPHGSLSGKVADSDGNPVSGAQIQAIRFIASAVPVIQPVGWATSANNGEYRIADLAPGSYYLLASPPTPRPALVHEALAPAYYPESPDLEGALRVFAAPGVPSTDLDFTLHKARASMVRGRVVSDSGEEPGDSLRLMITPRVPGCTGAAELRSVPIEKNGDFLVTGVPPGEYVLTATAREGDAVLEGRANLEIGDSDIDAVHIVLTRGVAVNGRIVFDGNRARDTGKLQITFSAMDAFAIMPALTSSVSGDALEFGFDKVAPGAWTLDVSGLPANTYIKAISAGGRELLDRSLDISLVPPGLIEVRIGIDAGRLEGVVKDLPTGRRAGLVMLPDSRKTSAFRKVTTAVSDAAGRFTINGIAPGDYRLFAFEEADIRQMQDSGFLDHFEKSAAAISVGPGATVNVEVSAIPAETVSAESASGF
jgi:protocatechuate 3,4-dioxygenase beta subunit